MTGQLPVSTDLVYASNCYAIARLHGINQLVVAHHGHAVRRLALWDCVGAFLLVYMTSASMPLLIAATVHSLDQDRYALIAQVGHVVLGTSSALLYRKPQTEVTLWDKAL